MKRLIITLIILLANKVFSQNFSDQIKTMQLNAAPAYVILGVEPENIQRPGSPSEFISNVQSAVVNNRLQPNFAMETSPYYLGKTKTQDTFALLNYLVDNSWSKNMLKSISLSFATSPSDTFTFGRIPLGTGLAAGVRVQLCQGKISKKSKLLLAGVFYNSKFATLTNAIIQALETDKNIADIDSFLVNEFTLNTYANIPSDKLEFLKNLAKNIISSSDSLERLDALRKTRTKVLHDLSITLQNINSYQFPLTREGFILELAIADARIFEQNQIDKISYGKTAIWLTPSYRFNVNKDPSVINYLDIMAVGRLTLNSIQADSSNYADAGGKLQWTRNKFSVAAEFIYRYLTNKPVNQTLPYTYKSDFTFSYKLNELVTFKTTFGKNFDGNSAEYTKPSKIFIVGGFNFGINGLKKQQ